MIYNYFFIGDILRHYSSYHIYLLSYFYRSHSIYFLDLHFPSVSNVQHFLLPHQFLCYSELYLLTLPERHYRMYFFSYHGHTLPFSRCAVGLILYFLLYQRKETPINCLIILICRRYFQPAFLPPLLDFYLQRDAFLAAIQHISFQLLLSHFYMS